MITDEVITKESGQYDQEIIQHLRLEKYGKTFKLNSDTHVYDIFLLEGISKISNLDSCISLVELNLARNEVWK